MSGERVVVVVKQPPRAVVIAVDEGMFSEKAVEFAMKHLLDTKDVVTLIHARPFTETESITDPFFLDDDMTRFDYSKLELEKQREARNLLDHFKAKLNQEGFNANAIELVGDVKELLVKEIQKIVPAFVVTGSRGLGLLQRILLGSVSEYLVHYMNIPVLIVR
jgi:nucleotide-binding universal stress UspA family protein